MATKNSDTGEKAAMASLTRIQNLGSNGTPDIIFMYGGGNDKFKGVTVGNFDPAEVPSSVDLTSTKWDTFADSCVAAIMRMQYYYPETKIVVLMSFVGGETEYIREMRKVCDHFDIPFIFLNEYGLEDEMHPDGVHPDDEGMDVITSAILEKLSGENSVAHGNNKVYGITHNLTEAEASKSYYKGVSEGATFEESLTGKALTVTVIMGGVDITREAYSDGKIRIDLVTGDVVITAKAAFSLDGHLQQLPEKMCSGTNLWEALGHESVYYTATGWGELSSGTARSITIPITSGQQIFATSFGARPENGNTISSSNGTRVTWFGENGVLRSMSPGETYAEYVANGGYLIAPEGAVAVNIPMWTEGDHEVYILNYGHTYKNGICNACGGSVLDEGYTHAVPDSQGVKNAIDRAYSLTDVEWTPILDVPGVLDVDGVYNQIVFEAGTTYKGIPYSGVTANDCYVGLNVSLESFLTALENKNSVLYTENLNSTNPKSATYFGTVCSKFVQYVLNVPGSYNTNNVANIPGMVTIAMPGEYTVEQIKLGDVILNTSTHTTICTDILYDEEGNVAYIEVSEAISPVCRRLYWSKEEFYESFADYRLCRYQYIENVPSISDMQLSTDYALMPRFGNKYNYQVGSTDGVVDILQSGYSKAVILRDGVVENVIVLGGETEFTFDRSLPGYIEMYLEKEDGTRSESVYACVVESSASVIDSSDFTSGKLIVSINGSSGTPLYVQVGSAHAIFCEVGGENTTFEIAFQFSRVSTKQVRVAYANEYGVYLSEWSSFTSDENYSSDPLLSQAEYWNGYNITPNDSTPIVQEDKAGYWSYTLIPVEENTTYYSVGATRMWFLDAAGKEISTFNAYKDGTVPFRFTTPSGACYVNIAYAPDLVEKGTEPLVVVTG